LFSSRQPTYLKDVSSSSSASSHAKHPVPEPGVPDLSFAVGPTPPKPEPTPTNSLPFAILTARVGSRKPTPSDAGFLAATVGADHDMFSARGESATWRWMPPRPGDRAMTAPVSEVLIEPVSPLPTFEAG